MLWRMSFVDDLIGMWTVLCFTCCFMMIEILLKACFGSESEQPLAHPWALKETTSVSELPGPWPWVLEFNLNVPLLD